MDKTLICNPCGFFFFLVFRRSQKSSYVSGAKQDEGLLLYCKPGPGRGFQDQNSGEVIMVTNTCIHILLTSLILCFLSLFNVPEILFWRVGGGRMNMILLVLRTLVAELFMSRFLSLYMGKCLHQGNINYFPKPVLLSAVFVMNFPKLFRSQLRREHWTPFRVCLCLVFCTRLATLMGGGRDFYFFFPVMRLQLKGGLNRRCLFDYPGHFLWDCRS